MHCIAVDKVLKLPTMSSAVIDRDKSELRTSERLRQSSVRFFKVTILNVKAKVSSD